MYTIILYIVIFVLYTFHYFCIFYCLKKCFYTVICFANTNTVHYSDYTVRVRSDQVIKYNLNSWWKGQNINVVLKIIICCYKHQTIKWAQKTQCMLHCLQNFLLLLGYVRQTAVFVWTAECVGIRVSWSVGRLAFGHLQRPAH